MSVAPLAKPGGAEGVRASVMLALCPPKYMYYYKQYIWYIWYIYYY